MTHEPTNTFDKLNAVLFDQIERLANAKSEEDMEREIERSQEVSRLANSITSNHQTAIKLMQTQREAGFALAEVIQCRPRMLSGGR